jgi:hypothetical protein
MTTERRNEENTRMPAQPTPQRPRARTRGALHLHAALLVTGLSLFAVLPGSTPTANVTPLPPAWDRTPDLPAAAFARGSSARTDTNAANFRHTLYGPKGLMRLDR